MNIAADCCIYTNHNFTKEEIKTEGDQLGSMSSEPKQLEDPESGIKQLEEKP